MATKFQPLDDDKTEPPTAVLTRGLSVPRLPENDRIAKYMSAAATMVETHTGSKEGGQCLRASAPFLAGIFWVAVKVAPVYAWLFEKGTWVYAHAPKVRHALEPHPHAHPSTVERRSRLHLPLTRSPRAPRRAWITERAADDLRRRPLLLRRHVRRRHRGGRGVAAHGLAALVRRGQVCVGRDAARQADLDRGRQGRRGQERHRRRRRADSAAARAGGRTRVHTPQGPGPRRAE